MAGQIFGEAVFMKPLLWVASVERAKVVWLGDRDETDPEPRLYRLQLQSLLDRRLLHKAHFSYAFTPVDEKFMRQVLCREEVRAFRTFQAKNRQRVAHAVRVTMSNGDVYIIFERPIITQDQPMRRSCPKKETAGLLWDAKQEKLFAISAFEFSITAAPRFGGAIYRLDYPKALKLSAGAVLEYQLSMHWGFDPRFSDLPPRPDGTNALTNAQTLSLPHIRPYGATWAEKRYRDIRPLEQVSTRLWDLYLMTLHRRIVTPPIMEVAQIIRIGSSKGEETLRPKKMRRHRHLSFAPNEEDILNTWLVGATVVHHCKLGDLAYIANESFLYNTSIALFSERDDAIAYAKGGEERRRVVSNRLVRFYHRGTEEAINERICSFLQRKKTRALLQPAPKEVQKGEPVT